MKAKPLTIPRLLRRRALKTAELGQFVGAVGRTARGNGQGPNDRAFDPKFSKQLRRLPAQEFDRLLRDDED